jgi:hypothetical protein
MIQKVFSFLLIVLIFGSGFVKPPEMSAHLKMNIHDGCMMKQHQDKPGGCNKQHNTAPFCNFCVLCIAFIVPVKPELQRNFASLLKDYPDMGQSKLTDFNSSHWRPPNA